MIVLPVSKENLKPGNIVTYLYKSEFHPNGREQKCEIMSETKQYVVLDNLLEIDKNTLRPWNFLGEVLSIEK